jgi:3-hydroxyacyl-[acyl-carrier-protein] dehydratase
MRWILVDKILECDPGKTIVASKTFTRSEEFFLDHFPGHPIVPGVLQIEMIAHAGSRCIALLNTDHLAILGAVRSAKFYRPIEPGSLCRIKVQIMSLRKSFAMAEGEIEVDGERVCSVELMFAMMPRTNLKSNHEDEVLSEWRKKNPSLMAPTKSEQRMSS